MVQHQKKLGLKKNKEKQKKLENTKKAKNGFRGKFSDLKLAMSSAMKITILYSNLKVAPRAAVGRGALPCTGYT